ncbi:MAG TPA: hypothetical protein VFR90_02865 [Methylibium sp.]|uniref:hypothetical protein n=1 Tax=Methylibium sp. TaxID=2067992 RepID=UPI002DB55871|nr:hypothetical protein [Methylibium sp.]HEU4458045.1 hypothetical protein [Methylibium sp.]
MPAFIPYGLYWSTPFAKWQGSLANMNALRLAAITGRAALEARHMPMDRIDLAILGHTNPQRGSFYGPPYVTGLMASTRWPGPPCSRPAPHRRARCRWPRRKLPAAPRTARCW